MVTSYNHLKKLAIAAGIIFISTNANSQQAGTINTNFTSGINSTEPISNIVVQPDGKLIIGGSLSTYNGISRMGIARIYPNGDLDISFDPGQGAPGANGNGGVMCITQQPNNKILIGGFFGNYNGTNINCIARLNPDGSLDTTFQHENVNGNVQQIFVQDDGKILIAGDFLIYDSVPKENFTRINTDGSLDTSFNCSLSNTNANWIKVFSIALSADGKIYVGGYFNSCNGILCKNIVRLNQDGTPDTTFNTGSGANGYVTSINLFPNGKILLGGSFTQYNGQSVSNLIRINEDGSLDSTFNENLYSGQTVKIQHDGKIILEDRIYNQNSQTYTSTLTRLNNDASLDTTFHLGSATNGYNSIFNPDTSLNSIALFGNNIYVAGNFTIYDNTSIVNIVKLFNDPCSTPPPIGSSTQTLISSEENPATLEDIEIIGDDITWYASLEDFENNNLLPTDTIIESGTTYYATQTINGCESSEPLSIIINLTLNTEDFIKDEGLKYYPNPASDHITIITAESINQIKVFTLQGALVKEEQWNSNIGNLDLKSLEEGSYLLNIHTNSAVKQVLIIHTK